MHVAPDAGAGGAAGAPPASTGGSGGRGDGGGGSDAGSPPPPPPMYAQAAASPLSTDMLVVLMDFADSEFPIEPTEAAWSDVFFGTDESEGNHYWYEVSGGTFQLLPVKETFGV